MRLFNLSRHAKVFFKTFLLWVILLSWATLGAVSTASLCRADEPTNPDPLKKPADLDEAFFYFNPSLKGKNLESISQKDRYDENGDTLLTLAVRNDKSVDMAKLLKYGANPNIVAADGNSPISLAILAKDEVYLERLLKAGATPNEGHLKLAKNQGKLIAMLKQYFPAKVMKKIPMTQEEMEDFTIEHLVNAFEIDTIKEALEWENKNGRYYPSISVAVRLGRSPEVIKELLDEQADINENNRELGTPLAQAIERNRYQEYVDFLLSNGADPNQLSVAYNIIHWPLAEAVRKYRSDIVRGLFEHGAKLNVPGAEKADDYDEDPFARALWNGDYETVKLFIEAGANPKEKVSIGDGDMMLPIHLAAESDHPTVELFTLLMEHGANPKIKHKNCNVLSQIDWKDETIPTIVMLLELGVPVSNKCFLESFDESLYHLAVKYELKDLFLALTKAKVSPNVRDSDGDSPLYLAVRFKQPWFVKGLIQAGALVNGSVAGAGLIYADYDGVRMPNDDLLAQAVIYNDDPEVVQILLDAGVNINVKSNSYTRSTALHISVEEHKVAITEAILKKKGVNTEVRNLYGSTPLHLAVEDERTDLVKLLVAAGANVKAKDRYGQDSIDIANQSLKKKEELLEALGVKGPLT
jgi:ankyrin repeat protein